MSLDYGLSIKNFHSGVKHNFRSFLFFKILSFLLNVILPVSFLNIFIKESEWFEQYTEWGVHYLFIDSFVWAHNNQNKKGECVCLVLQKSKKKKKNFNQCLIIIWSSFILVIPSIKYLTWLSLQPSSSKDFVQLLNIFGNKQSNLLETAAR